MELVVVSEVRLRVFERPYCWHRQKRQKHIQESPQREGHQKHCDNKQRSTHPWVTAGQERVSPPQDSGTEQDWDEEPNRNTAVWNCCSWESSLVIHFRIPGHYPNHAVWGRMVAAFWGWSPVLNCHERSSGLTLWDPGHSDRMKLNLVKNRASSSLSQVESFSPTNMFQNSMVGPDHKGLLHPFQPISPLFPH